ncbi:MAG: hypothetical protein VKK42_15180 [Lyngbya sp.]|nr:hypothetical protein [Lyngbya sp.]
MKRDKIIPSTCKNCRAYKPEGRRGGLCQLFQVPVQSEWESCCFATLPFKNSWENKEPESQEMSEVMEASVEVTS